jgi:hypothetical protein
MISKKNTSIYRSGTLFFSPRRGEARREDIEINKLIIIISIEEKRGIIQPWF